MAAWDVIASEVEYETGWYTGGYDRVEQPDGSTKRYYWAALDPAVVVVAIRAAGAEQVADADGSATAADRSVVFVEQHRPTVGATHTELPAGLVEDDESYDRAGARELREETGYEPDRVTHLTDYAVATGVLRHDRGIVVAEGLRAVDHDRDENEFLTVREVPVDEAIATARAPPRNDATITGLLLAEREGYL